MRSTLPGLILGGLILLELAGCTQKERSMDASGRQSVKKRARPNVLLIVADDLGYADLGCYGSDITTPNIDALATKGIRFSQFHTAPYCAPSRAMLLTGNNNHVAGMALQGCNGVLTQSMPGYENHLSNRVAPFPGLLRSAGYHTYMVGKWHLGLDRADSPTAHGFERSMSLLDGAGSHWDGVGFFEGGSTFWEDGEYTAWPGGRYSTDLYTEKLIGFIEDGRRDGRPFFAYAAYTSPHWPLQVPEAYLDRYSGRYDQGYDRLREQRFASLKAAGIIPAGSVLPPRNETITPWAALDADQRRREARKMELYAAMVENLDEHVGRLVDYLKRKDLYDNTLIVFMADNGAAGEDFYNGSSYMGYVRAHYDNRLDRMGRPGSFVSYGPPWAEAGSAPFSRYKGYTREGGITAPMIIAGPGVSRSGAIERTYVTVMDLAPTFLDVASTGYPQRDGIQPMRGASMTAFLAGAADAVHDADYVTTLSHGGRALIRRGRWKLTNLDGPFAERQLALFDLQADPGETNDLATDRTDVYREMLELWRSERDRLGIIVPGDL